MHIKQNNENVLDNILYSFEKVMKLSNFQMFFNL